MLTDFRELISSRLFACREKIEVAQLFRGFAGARARAGETMADWLRRHVRSSRVRDFAATVIRISTFVTDLDRLSAHTALLQVQSGLTDGVLYLDGGWQTLVRRAPALAVEIRCGESIRSLDSVDAYGIVLAVSPGEVERLTGATLPSPVHVRMASLDLALAGIPDLPVNVAFALDRPLYFAAHSPSAQLAPPGNHVVHVAKYLGATVPDARAVRTELEQYADLVFPGWRQHLIFARFLPELTVSSGLPAASPLLAQHVGGASLARQTQIRQPQARTIPRHLAAGAATEPSGRFCRGDRLFGLAHLRSSPAVAHTGRAPGFSAARDFRHALQ